MSPFLSAVRKRFEAADFLAPIIVRPETVLRLRLLTDPCDVRSKACCPELLLSSARCILGKLCESAGSFQLSEAGLLLMKAAANLNQ